MNSNNLNLIDLIRKPFEQMNDEEREAALKLGLVVTNDRPTRIRSGRAKNIQIGYWIHEKVLNPASVTGFFYKRSCTCSICGYESNTEKKRCPSCQAIMLARPKEETPQK